MQTVRRFSAVSKKSVIPSAWPRRERAGSVILRLNALGNAKTDWNVNGVSESVVLLSTNALNQRNQVLAMLICELLAQDL